MSQSGSYNINSGGGGTVSTLTGNTGAPVISVGGNINVFGSGSLTSNGATPTLTFSLTGLTNHSVLLGQGTDTINSLTNGTNGQVLTAVTGGDPVWSAIPASNLMLQGNAGGPVSAVANIINTIGTGSITSSGVGNSITFSLTGLTNHSVLLGAGTATITSLVNGTTGQILTAVTGSDPVWSSNSFVNSILTITGNSGGAETPLANNFNILGTGSITIVGSANTETVQLTGLTNHAIQIGAGTATLTQLGAGTTGQVLQTNTGADPTWSTATYPSTTTINQILYSSSNNVVAGLSTANNGVLTTGATGVPTITQLATDGQLLIGSSSGPPTAATITAGTGISVTNGANSITIAVTSSNPLTFHTDFGDAVPAANAITLNGSGSITTTGSGSTVVTKLTGLTNHALQVGAGTTLLTQLAVGATGQILQGNTSADPSWTSTPSVTSITLSGGTPLSSYIEGSWTPGIAFGGGTTGITYSLQSARYIRVGNVVHVGFAIFLTSKGSSTGQATLTGLPITSGSLSTDINNFPLPFSNDLTFTGIPYVVVGNTSTVATFVYSTSSVPQTIMTNANFVNNTQVGGNFSYIIAS